VTASPLAASASDPIVASWAAHTYDQPRIHAALARAGIAIVLSHRIARLDGDGAVASCVFTGAERRIPCEGLVPVTSREPNDGLFRELKERTDHPFTTLLRIGDCAAPGLIAHAVHDGHRAAREFDAEEQGMVSLRERVIV